MSAQPIRTVDQLVDTYLDLADKIAQLTEQQAGVKAQLRDLGVGDHAAKNGVVVKVTPPSRRFNVDLAWTMLTEEQQKLSVGPIAAQVKKRLSGDLVDACMEDGKGDPTVKVVTP